MTCTRVLGAAVAALSIGITAQDAGVTKGKTAAGLAYERTGSGPAVVLIHGAFLDRRMWDREVEWLEKQQATVVRYDQRAHGESQVPTTPFSNVDDLLALLDELKIARATLVGLSSGSQVALDTALAAPARVDRLVLMAPAISGYVEQERPPFMLDLIAALKEKDYKRANDVMLASPVYAAPEASRALVRAMVTSNERIWSLDRTLVRQPATPALGQLEKVAVPTLVLVGDRDAAGMLDQAEILATRVPGARKVVIAGGTHLLNLSSPAEVETEIRPFLGTGRPKGLRYD